MWVGFVGAEHGACNIYTIVSPPTSLVAIKGSCSDMKKPIPSM